MQEAAGRLSRRNLLKTGLVGTLLVGVGSVGLALERTKVEGQTPALAVLSATEYAVLVAVAERLCPALGEGAPGATALGVAKTIDGLLTEVDDDTQKGFKIALRTFENALTGALFGERFVPFTHLSPEDKTRTLASWRDSRIGFRRTVYRALGGLVWAVYWGDARTWPRIGYPGPRDVAALRAQYVDNLVDLDALRATPHGSAKEN